MEHLYRRLLGDFGEERYHRGAAAEDVAGDGVRLAGGADRQADLVVAADGIDLDAAAGCCPRCASARPPTSAGAAWSTRRSLPEETAAQLGGGITYHAAPGTHIVVYPSRTRAARWSPAAGA